MLLRLAVPADGRQVAVPRGKWWLAGACCDTSAPPEAVVLALSEEGAGERRLGLVDPQLRLGMSVAGGARLSASGPLGTVVHVMGRRDRADRTSRRPQKRPRRSSDEARREVAALDDELGQWLELCRQRRALASEMDSRGVGWEEQARSQGLPVDEAAAETNRLCCELIAREGYQRGVVPPGAWARDAAAAVGPCGTWEEFGEASGMPSEPSLRAVLTDALSFPLTAALAARLAGVRASADGTLTLLLLGAEAGAELGGREAQIWAELVGGHGLGVSLLRLLFAGPKVPKRLAGRCSRVELGGGAMEIRYVRGLWHDAMHEALGGGGGGGGGAGARSGEWRVDLALAFNSGLAEFAASWVPTWRAVMRESAAIAITSYHEIEAELDAKTLVYRAGADRRRLVACATPNPFSSQLPHLDELFPGRTYAANAFLSVYAAGSGG